MIPKQIMDAIKKSEGAEGEVDRVYLCGRENPELLEEFDYTNKSGWVYAQNHVGIPLGASRMEVADGDVIRLSFTIYGYGADVFDNSQWGSGKLYDLANKDQLVLTLAEYE